MKSHFWFFMIGILITVHLVGCSGGIDTKKFDGAARAAQAVQNALDNQDDYMKFGELFGIFSNEMIALRDRVTNEKERQLLNAYDDLLITYQDGFQLWEYKVESSRYPWIPEGRIYLDPKIIPLALKYNLSVQTHIVQITKYEFESVPADALNLIWARARVQFGKIKS